MDRRCSQRGSVMVLTAAIVLPLLFFFFALTLDVERYFRMTKDAQEIADDASLYGYRFLPDTAAAKSALDGYMSKHPLLKPSTTFQVDSDFIQARIDTVAPFSFGELVGSLTGNDTPLGIPVRAFSEVRGTPLNAAVVMDVGGSLAPDINSDGWTLGTDWPVAELFSQRLKLTTAFGKELNSASVTQQCFNPVLSPLKRLTLSLYSHLASYKLNGVGLGFMPGAEKSIEFSHEVLPQALSPFEHWIWSVSGTGEMRNDYCLAAATYEVNHHDYSVPLSPNSTSSPPIASDEVPIHPGLWTFNPKYQPTAAEVVWSQAVREGKEGNIEDVLLRLGTRLVSPSIEGSRGGLKNSTVAIGFILTENLPLYESRYPASSAKNAIERAMFFLNSYIESDEIQKNLRLKIYYVLLHSKYEFAPLRGLDVSSEIASLRQLFNELSTERITLQLVESSEPDKLTSKLVDSLVLETKTGMISR